MHFASLGLYFPKIPQSRGILVLYSQLKKLAKITVNSLHLRLTVNTI